jgi:hypothetical protein
VVNELFGGGLENRIYYLPFEALDFRFAADDRTLRIEEAKAAGSDPALGRIISMLKKEIPLRAAAPPESREFERAFAGPPTRRARRSPARLLRRATATAHSPSFCVPARILPAEGPPRPVGCSARIPEK